jgi:hypothetical protein
MAYEGGTNKTLLWHGSRLTNWTGILSQGLRIAPPEAPVTGYMFGKGACVLCCGRGLMTWLTREVGIAATACRRLFCRQRLQERQLLPHGPQEQHGPPLALRGGAQQDGRAPPCR